MEWVSCVGSASEMFITVLTVKSGCWVPVILRPQNLAWSSAGIQETSIKGPVTENSLYTKTHRALSRSLPVPFLLLHPHGQREPEFYVLFLIHPATLVLHLSPSLTSQLRHPLSAPLKPLPPQILCTSCTLPPPQCPISSAPAPSSKNSTDLCPSHIHTSVSQAQIARNFSFLSLDTVNPSTASRPITVFPSQRRHKDSFPTLPGCRARPSRWHRCRVSPTN